MLQQLLYATKSYSKFLMFMTRAALLSVALVFFYSYDYHGFNNLTRRPKYVDSIEKIKSKFRYQ